jgi:hypothetical protein
MPASAQPAQIDGKARTLKARRVRRFLCFMAEIGERLDGEPPFTEEERRQLALLIWPGTPAEDGER